MRNILIIIHLLLLCQTSFSQEGITKANFELADEYTASRLSRLYHPRLVRPFWLDESGTFLYPILQEGRVTLYYVDANKRKREPLEIEFDRDKDRNFLFLFKNRKYIFNQVSGEIARMTTPAELETGGSLSPDKNYSVSVLNHNLYITDRRSDQKNQLSFDGEVNYSFKADIDYNFTDEAVKPNTTPQAPNLTWSPNSQYFCCFRTDARLLKDMWVIDSVSEPRPMLHTYKQRNPGENRRQNEIWVYSVEEKNFHKLYLKKEPDESYWFLGWSETGTVFYVQRINWQQTQSDVLSIDAKKGTSRIIIHEDPQANVFANEFKELSEEEFLWWSRRDGWGHLYKYDRDGKVIKQLTKGHFNVTRFYGLDEEANRLLFTAVGKEKGQNPYYTFFYNTDAEGGDLRLLTPEDAEHSIHLAPDGTYFVDNFSRADLPHRSVLRDMDGRLIMTLESADTTDLDKSPWQAPEIFTVKSADEETDLWGVLWKPFDFDPQKKYPIISYVYPGPQTNYVPLCFFQELNNVHLAQYGFIVVMCGTRGSSRLRSLQFSEHFRDNLRDYPLADNKAMIEQLADRYLFIDISKVGIWGGSSGGFMAAAAMFTYPDFYKAGVSRSAQHDPSVFHGWWSDIFHGNPGRADSEWKTIPSNLTIAKNLKGKLLIIHGEIDMNVHPSNSARLVQSLMKANKNFDYLVVPGGAHGWSRNWRYMQRRIWLYFVEHLIGDQSRSIDLF